MQHKKLLISAVLLIVFGLKGLQTQTSANATGGDASGCGGSSSFSVGQFVYGTNAGTHENSLYIFTSKLKSLDYEKSF